MDRLYEKIKDAGYEPERVVGIARGGSVPATILGYKFDVQVYHINVEKDGDKRIVTVDIKEDLTGKNCLLVEDNLLTGRSLGKGKNYLEKEKGAEVKTACLYTTKQTEVKPDFFIRKVDEIPKFPWE
ncbi:MAG: hypothetical protein JSV92_00055 [archaeon]|nr:MAG: hypothetical protein JSV92_00055 [archaeon]